MLVSFSDVDSMVDVALNGKLYVKFMNTIDYDIKQCVCQMHPHYCTFCIVKECMKLYDKKYHKGLEI